jgi:hypothetical protein
LLRSKLIELAVRAADVALAPFTALSAALLRTLRRAGTGRTPVARRILRAVGVFPVIDHYYEPRFDYGNLRQPLGEDRDLPGIDWNDAEQLALLERFDFDAELESFPDRDPGNGAFYFQNGNFGAGDAEILYSLLRLHAPARFIEVGGGFSTLIAHAALGRNAGDGRACRHLCIEPFEMPWLDRLQGIEVLRRRVEDVDPGVFQELDRNDVLFIDSSHVIRPQGDVLFLLQRVLPRLRPGVLVHVHDIFSPRDYPAAWLVDQVKFWNEQYLLEAFLTCNRDFRIIGALNYLFQHHRDRLLARCPALRRTPGLEPGSFWMVRN